jgi:hypothetical protein
MVGFIMTRAPSLQNNDFDENPSHKLIPV